MEPGDEATLLAQVVALEEEARQGDATAIRERLHRLVPEYAAPVGGAVGVVEVTTAARPHDFEASISVLTEKGTAVLGGIACNELWTWTPAPEACAANSETFPNVYGLGHTPFIRDVVREILEGMSHPTSLEEGTRAIRLLNAIYRSAEDGVSVFLKDHPASRLLGRPDPGLSARYLTPPQPEIAKD